MNSTAATALQQAQEHHQAGRLPEAERLLQQALAAEAQNPEALYLLGVVSHQTGDSKRALELMERAAKLEPACWKNLGLLHANLGRQEDAARCLRHAIDYAPQDIEALNGLGIALMALERPAEAERAYRELIAVAPVAAAYSNLGNALNFQQRWDDAEAALRRAIELDASFAVAHNNLGNALRGQGRAEDAQAAYRRAIELDPNFAQAHSNLGNMQRQLGRMGDAERSYRRALELMPRDAFAHCNLAGALCDLERYTEAANHSREAIALRPAFALAHINLGHALKHGGQLVDGVRSYRKALELEPNLADAHAALAGALMALGKLDEAEASYRKALELNPDFVEAHTNLIFMLDMHEARGVEIQQAERRRWYERHGRRHAAAIRPHANVPDPERRLKIGFVSADFRNHSSYYAFGPILLGLDRSRFEVTCYSGVYREDRITERLRRGVDAWRSTVGVSDDALAEQIRADGIDILVDPAGHSAGHRLLAFARKPAPVQVTHGAGSGVAAVDYLLADPVLVPAEERGHYAEKVLELPCCFCYEPPEYLPPVSPQPVLAGKPFTFACFNRMEKITDGSIAMWARILRQVPWALLLVKTSGLENMALRGQFERRLAEAGIPRERTRFLGKSNHADHLASYREADLILDPAPHGGGISTAEAIFMGLPVVTLKGGTPSSRVSAAVLRGAGIPEWAARDEDEYVRIAVEASAQPARLAEVRKTMRERVLRSDLGDTKRYCKAVEETYRRIWREWCASRK